MATIQSTDPDIGEVYSRLHDLYVLIQTLNTNVTTLNTTLTTLSTQVTNINTQVTNIQTTVDDMTDPEEGIPTQIFALKTDLEELDRVLSNKISSLDLTVNGTFLEPELGLVAKVNKLEARDCPYKV